MDKNLSLIQEGRTADHVMSLIRPFINARKEMALKKLKGLYREKNRDGLELSLVLGEYCSMEDLEAEIERAMKRGNTAAKEIINGN